MIKSEAKERGELESMVSDSPKLNWRVLIV